MPEARTHYIVFALRRVEGGAGRPWGREGPLGSLVFLRFPVRFSILVGCGESSPRFTRSAFGSVSGGPAPPLDFNPYFIYNLSLSDPQSPLQEPGPGTAMRAGTAKTDTT